MISAVAPFNLAKRMLMREMHASQDKSFGVCKILGIFKREDARKGWHHVGSEEVIDQQPGSGQEDCNREQTERAGQLSESELPHSPYPEGQKGNDQQRVQSNCFQKICLSEAN